MTALARLTCAALALVGGTSVTARAQQQACEIRETGDIAKATFTLTRARGDQNPQQATKHLRDALKTLNNRPERMDAVGRNFVLGQVYVEWAKQAAPTYRMNRADVGLSGEGQIDLLAAADSAFRAVEQAKPECRAEVAQYRQQQPWLDLINAGVNALNADQLDSAEALVRRSMVLYEESPYTYHLLASIEQNRSNYSRAIELRKRAIQTAGDDTLYTEVRNASLLNLGLLAANQTNELEGEQQKALAVEAANAMRTFLRDAPQDDNAPVAQQTLARMLVLTGDTTNVRSIYAAQLASPMEFSDLALVNAGVIAAQADQAADAAALFDAALKKNPNYRDALYNLAASLYAMDRHQEMLPVVRRLVAVDPSNPDNWRLYAFAFQGMSKTAASEQAKRAQTDSLVKYYEMSEKMPVRVSFSQFTRGDGRATLAGNVENRGGAARTYQLRVEFLDQAGNVVSTEVANVGPVAPKESGRFSITVQSPNVVAFRYAPISS